MCLEPFKCNYPDKYSGYDGAIRCLVERGGDVAFTKVIYVRRYFGVCSFIMFFCPSISDSIFELFLFYFQKPVAAKLYVATSE